MLHHGQDLLVIAGDGPRSGAEILVPFVTAIVPEVDVAGGRLVIDPPPGLLDPDEASYGGTMRSRRAHRHRHHLPRVLQRR